MNSFLHTFFSPILYFELFGGFGYILISLFIIALISSLKLKGKPKYLSVAVIIACVSSLFAYSCLPIDTQDETRLRDHVSRLTIEIIENPELNQERRKILNDFRGVIDKGYINRLEEANTYNKIVELNRKQVEYKTQQLEEIAKQVAEIEEKALD